MRKNIIITDPIHQVMNFGSRKKFRNPFKALLNTQTFQRLQRTSQLGLVSYLFPGATHTRFAHSLGVAYLAHQVLRHLVEREKGEAKVIKERRLEVVFAALLHDVGHGPFSHLFEEVLHESNQPQQAPMHEDWTAWLITDPHSEIYQVLTQNGLDPTFIASFFAETSTQQAFPLYLKQIVSSQLDVDRMDYLVRDSHFAGVDVGKIDVDYLINSLAVIKLERIKTLGLITKGIKAYESFIFARQQMIKTVYHHHKVLVFEFMMAELIRKLIIHYQALIEIKALRGQIPPYLKCMHQFWFNPQPGDKVTFMQQNRSAYVQFTEDTVWTLLTNIAHLSENNLSPIIITLAQMLLTHTPLTYYPILAVRSTYIEENLIKKGFKPGDDFAVITHTSTVHKSADEAVFVLGNKAETHEIHTCSEILSMFQDRRVTQSLLVIINEAQRKAIVKIVQKIDGFDQKLM